MSKTAKRARSAALSKRTKGDHAGEDKREKPKCPHQQPAPNWCTVKLKKKNSAAALASAKRRLNVNAAQELTG